MRKAWNGRCGALAVAAGLALGLGPAGCEREDPAGEKLREAQVKLTSLAPYGTTVTAGEKKSRALTEVISTLQGLDKPTPTQSASAAVMIAQAHTGLGEPHATRMVELEGDVLLKLSSVRGALAQYLSQSAGALAAAGYSPSADLATLDRQTQEKTAETEQARAAKAEVEKKVADLRGRARVKLDESRAKRQQAGSLKQQMANQTATQGEQTLIEATRISREADALDKDAADLEAQAKAIEPRVAEIQNTIERLNKQKELLGKEREGVLNRDRELKQRAAALRADAAKSAEEIRTLLASVHAVRTGELAEAAEEASKRFTSAAESARRAVGEMKGSASMAVGAARQALGDVKMASARGMLGYASVLELLSQASPPLPEADAIKSRLAETKAAMKETLDAAFEAYKEASEAYNSSGAGGEASKQVDKITRKLRDLVKLAGGDGEMISVREAEAPADPGAGEVAAGVATETGTPQATLQALIDAQKSGDFDPVMDLFMTGSDAERQTLRAVLGLAPKWKRFDEACKAKFGQTFTEFASRMGGGMGGMGAMDGGMGLEQVASAADIPVQVSGDTATASVPGGAPMTLHLRDGKWLIDMSPVMAQVGPMGGMMAGMTSAVEALTRDVEAGKFQSFEQLMMAFGQRMQGLMGGGMGGMGPGGG
ncbi:MAG: hypothetical protein KF678_03770 [Phycisphaeraceae bacterium]|nr:hypothetical protein [Phycisphaeraceae bacterium]